MRLFAKIRFVLIAAALLCRVAAGGSFTATLDRDTATKGEPVTLSLNFEDIRVDSAPSLPKVDGLDFQYTGQSSAFQMANGKTTATVTYNYNVVSRREGRFVIPGFHVNVGGQSYNSSPLDLTISQASAPTPQDLNSGNQVAFMKIVLPRKQMYLGESVMGSLDIYLRDDVVNINGFQLTSSGMDGFSIGKWTETHNQRQVQVGNRVYKVVSLSLPVTPTRAGQLPLGPFTANLGVIRDQGNDPFARFFNRGELSQASLATESVTVDARPLPEAGKPAGFSGAIGDFSMNVSVGPTELTVGDPITVRVQVTGRGSIESLSLPIPDSWHDFKAYPPTVKFEPGDSSGFSGTKTFEQIITPQNAEVHELPAFSFSYFNPDDGQYHTLGHAATPLTVHSAGATALPALAAAKSPQQDSTPQDIIPIRENLGTLAPSGTPLIGQPVFLALQSTPVLALIAAFIWRKRTDNLANNPRLRRQRAVAQLVAEGLNGLEKHAAANQPEEFFALLFRLLQEQLGERLEVPASAITEADVDDRLVRQGASAATMDSLRELFQLCNQARYAPVRGTSELNSLVAKLKPASAELQGLKR